ncbi:MAG: LytTR family DNA-binding domain-containing protein [Cyclobacteriaceae bacterium]
MILNENFVFIKSGKRLTKVFFDDILLIKGLGNYVEIVTPSKKHIYYRSLKDLIEILPNQFMRVHLSYIINLVHVDYMEDHQIHLKEHKINVGSSYRECLRQALDTRLL